MTLRMLARIHQKVGKDVNFGEINVFVFDFKGILHKYTLHATQNTLSTNVYIFEYFWFPSNLKMGHLLDST